ncbi:uncharacterized protein LOC124160622 [Ischnura elegans]|uniref:uncharacterized protein LOC124160622 n=1 Tax=Ischnura elegans TaxID=197161 RepID=UPI001ED8AA23|nr:uncharacterized protein LOC124160622 [Ischnura elegans]
MEVPVHGKIWHIPRPSLWWKTRHNHQGDVEGGGWQHRSPTERDAAPRPSYAASDASTSSSSTTTPVGSLHSPLVREGHARPTWIPTALPPLEVDGGLKKGSAAAATTTGTGPLCAGDLDADAKAEDAVSIASSTHFTVVGGYSGGRGVRSRSRGLKAGKITALVLSMSLLILIGILAAILLLEVRARNMHWPKTT